MTKLGYIEGQNISYNMQTSDDPAKEQVMAKQLVDEKVDLIFAFPAPPTAAAYSAAQGTNIPVVFAYYQLEGNNLVKSVQKTGREHNRRALSWPGIDKSSFTALERNGSRSQASLGRLR